MNKNIRTSASMSIMATLLAFTSACEKHIDADIPYDDPYLSAICAFSPDSVWVVRVSQSAHILDDTGPTGITNATVEIYEEGVLLETLPYAADYPYSEIAYRGTSRPTAGKAYSLKVSVPGHEPISATSRVPNLVPAVTVTYQDSVSSDGFGGYVDEAKVRFWDPAGERNYYALQFAHPDTFDNGMGDSVIYWAGYYVYGADNGITEPDFTGQHLLSDELFDGKEIELTFRVDSWLKANGESLHVFLASLTEEHYKFVVTSNAYQQVYGNPFAEPVLIYSNLTGGYGIFSGYNVAKTPLY